MFRIACLALLAAPAFAAAQPHGYRGGMSAPGYHGGVGAPGFRAGLDAPGYRGNLNNYGYRGGYSTFSTFGVPYGGLGYPYGYPYGGITLGYGFGGLGYGYGMGSAYGSGTSFGYRDRMVPLSSPGILAPQTIPVEPTTSSSKSAATAVVDVVVPEGAKVWFDDKEADVKNGKASYTSPVIEPGRGPTFHLKANWDGRDRDMYLTLRAGDKMSIDLRKN